MTNSFDIKILIVEGGEIWVLDIFVKVQGFWQKLVSYWIYYFDYKNQSYP